MKHPTIYNWIKSISATNPTQSAFGFKMNDQWAHVSYKEYMKKTDLIASILASQGIKIGDVVLSYSNNCPDLNYLDLALNKLGAIHAIAFPNYTVDNLVEVIDYVQPKFAIANSGLFLQNMIKAKEKASHTFTLFSFSKNTKQIPVLEESLTDEEVAFPFDDVNENTAYSIYFTSGTTGTPKGALVKNSAIIGIIEALQQTFPIPKGEKAISLAPLSVSSERCLNYFYQCSEMTTYYCTNMQRVIEDMQVVQPSMFLTSPLMLHKVRENVYLKAKEVGNKWLQKLFLKALNYADDEMNLGKKGLSFYIYDTLIYKKLRGIFGGKVRYIVSGGAASIRKNLLFFHHIGVPVYEGYGMSECHTITVNTPKDIKKKYNTVGKPIGKTEVKLSDTHEVWCKSPYMFIEYYKLPTITQNSFTEDGYFKTGDMGAFSDDGNLIIKGRIKSLFKTLSGVYINPERIEALLMQEGMFDHVLIIGENKAFLTALVYPNEQLREQSNDAMTNSILAAIENYNSSKVEAEQVQNYILLKHPFTVENKELTTSLKPIRANIIENYSNEINKLYDTP